MAARNLILSDLPWQIKEKINPDLHLLLFERTLDRDRKAVVDQELKHYYKLVTGEESDDMQKVITFLKQVNLLHTAIYGWKDIPMHNKIKELKSYDRNSPEVKDLLYRILEYIVSVIEEAGEGFLNDDQESPDSLLIEFRNTSRNDSLDSLVSLFKEFLNFTTRPEETMGEKKGLLLPIMWYTPPPRLRPSAGLFGEGALAFSIVGNVLLHLPNMFTNTPSNIRKYNLFKRDCRADIIAVDLYFRYFERAILDNDLVYQRAEKFLVTERLQNYNVATASRLVGRERDRHFEQVVGQSIYDLFYRLYIEKQKNIKSNIDYHWTGEAWVKETTTDPWTAQYKKTTFDKL